MLALYFLSLEMIVQVGILPLENSHHLVYFDFETIKFASIHIGVMIAHKMLENGVNFISIMRDFENIFAQIVHSLEVTNILVVKRIHPKHFHQMNP